MRISIRLKLMLGVAAPLIVVLALLGWNSFRARRQDALEQQQLVLSREAEAMAGRFEAELRAVAQIARSNAAILSTYPNLSDEEVYELLERSLDQAGLAYGACIAFDPAGGGRGTFAPYVHRTGVGAGARGTMARKDVARVYDYAGGSWEWFARARDEGLPIWTEPYADDAADGTVMCTFSAPFYHMGRFVGVATIDVQLADLTDLAASRNGQSAWVAVLSAGGRVLVWPEDTNERVAHLTTYTQISQMFGRPELVELGRQMTLQQSAKATIRDLRDPSRVLLVAYTPIPAARWSLAAALDKDKALASVYRELGDRAFSSALILALVTCTVLSIGWWLIRPLNRLAEGVSALGAGNLDAPPVRVRTNDEIGDLSRAFNRMLRQLKQRVDEVTEATRQREAVLSELRVARDIQASLLPQLDPIVTQSRTHRLHAVNAPARGVAGDFYDFFTLHDGRLAIVIADVAGKGVPASLFMAVARTVVRDLATRGEPPGRVLSEANQRLLADNQAGLFVTIFIGYFDRATGSMTYANGGHQLPLVVSNGVVRRFGRSTGTIVGALRDQAFGAEQEQLAPGEALVLYTDGVPDARRRGSGEFFGEERLAETLRAVTRGQDARDPAELCTEILRRLDEWQGTERSDDVTVLVLSRSES